MFLLSVLPAMALTNPSHSVIISRGVLILTLTDQDKVLERRNGVPSFVSKSGESQRGGDPERARENLCGSLWLSGWISLSPALSLPVSVSGSL